MTNQSHSDSCSGHDSCNAQNSKAERSLMDSLPDRHLIRILMCEHQEIRSRLDELEKLADEISLGETERSKTLTRMGSIGEQLVAAEPHHQREEKILFPELESRGVSGPTQVMLSEHVSIRKLKHFIADESKRLLTTEEAPTKIIAAARELVAELRGHINKENGVLYPMSLGVIRDQSLWDQMLTRSDEIGYCCTDQ